MQKIRQIHNYNKKTKVSFCTFPKRNYKNLPSYQMVGEGGFEPPKSLTTDLQSAPFGHSGILPYLIELLVKKWSWWTDSNPRPADYKSAALPAVLHQRVSLTLEYYIIFEKICQGKSGKYFIIPLFPISAIFPAFPQHDYPAFFGTSQGHHRRFLWRDDDFGW